MCCVWGDGECVPVCVCLVGVVLMCVLSIHVFCVCYGRVTISVMSNEILVVCHYSVVK